MTIKAHNILLAGLAAATIGLAGLNAAPAHAGDGRALFGKHLFVSQRATKGLNAPWRSYFGIGQAGADKIKLKRTNQRKLTRKANKHPFRTQALGEQRYLRSTNAIDRYIARQTYKPDGK